MKVNNTLKLFVGVMVFMIIYGYSHKGYSDTVKKIIEFTVSLNSKSVPETEKNTWYEEFGCFLNVAEASSNWHAPHFLDILSHLAYRQINDNLE